jgi:8-oxo-dGTP diphosphatase
MNVYLVRHAVAVGRSEWDRDDRLRPLTKKGERQSQALVDLVTAGDADVRRVLSSPALRCRDTVAPLASKLGLPVDEAAALAEGSKPKEAVALVHEVAANPFDTVLCAHGDLVPEVVRRLGREGMAWDGDLRFAKGSTWVLTFDGGRCVEGRYVPPGDR